MWGAYDGTDLFHPGLRLDVGGDLFQRIPHGGVLRICDRLKIEGFQLLYGSRQLALDLQCLDRQGDLLFPLVPLPGKPDIALLPQLLQGAGERGEEISRNRSSAPTSTGVEG